MNCTKSTTSVKMTSNHRLNVLQYFTGHFSCHWTRLYFLLLLITASKASNSHHCCSSHVKVNLEKGPGLFLQLPDEVQSEIEPGTSESSFQSQLNYRKQHQHQSTHHLHQLQHLKGSNAFTDESFEQNTLSPVNSPPNSLAASPPSSSSSSSTSNILTSDTLRYFTLLDIKNPVTVRASLGPLNVKKTLYPSSLLASIDHRLNKPTTSSVTGTSIGAHNLLPNVIAMTATTSHHQPHPHHHHQQQQQQLEKTDGQFKQPNSQKSTHGHNLLHVRSNNHRSITSATTSSAFNELELSSKLSNSSPDQTNSRLGTSRSTLHGNKKLQQQPFSSSPSSPSSSSSSSSHHPKIEVLDMETAARKVTPHLVTSEVTRNKPVLRILFHSGFGPDSPVHPHPHPHHHSYNSYANGHSGHRSNLCTIVAITDSSHGKGTTGGGSSSSSFSSSSSLVDGDGQTIYSFCSLNDASSTTCVTSTILPASWFPPVTMDVASTSSGSRPPSKGSMVKVSYSIIRSTIGCNESALASSIDPSVSPYLIKSLSKDVQNAFVMATSVGSNVFVNIFQVPLYPFRGSYEEVTADDMVKILVPQVPMYPLTQVYIPVVFKVNPSYPISAFSVRIRIKSGLKVIGAVAAPNSMWSISLEISPKANAATVTAYLKDDEDGQMMSQATNSTTILGDSSEDIVDTEDESTSGGAYEEDYLSDSSVRWSKEQLITLRKMHLLDRMGTSQSDVFSWLLQVEDMADVTDNGRVVWQLIYLTDSLQTNGHPVHSSPPVTLNSNSHGNYNSPRSTTSGTNGSGGLGANSNLISPSLTSSTVDSSKLTTRFDIRKDEIEKLIGITSTSEVLNTAVLTGKQISNLLKIYAISYSGKVGDVTLQSSCHSFDESVIKVSPSCSSIYLDGTEIRGSFNASIWIKYGSTYTGIVSFKIWMPKFPLEIDISDTKLSQIKSWKVPSSSFHSLANSKLGHHSSHLLSNFDDTSDFQAVQEAKHKGHRSKRHRRSPNVRVKRGQGDFGDTSESGSSSCRLKYQQGYLSVSAKFTATDSKNGRETYYVSRRASFNVDHLVGPFIRVADPRIAYLYTSDSGHLIVEGMSNGRTDIQIVSPITGAIIGKRDIKVTPEKESITRLEVSLVTGLNMNVTKLPPINSGGVNSYYTVKLTTNLNYFTSKFQEGFLLTQIYFSDGTSIYLNDIESVNYFLTIDLFDTNTLAVVPPVNGVSAIGTGSDTSSSASSAGGLNDGKFYYPRVIALAHGKDQLMHVALEMPLACQRKRTQQLALKYLNVNIDLNSAIQNDHKDGHHQVTSGSKGSRTGSAKGHPLESSHSTRIAPGPRVNEPRNSFLREILTNSNAKSKSSWRFVSGHGSLGGHVSNSFTPAAINSRVSNLGDEDDLDSSLDGILPSMTPLEIGIYAVLSFFTLAVMIFVASCMIFTFKGKPMKSSPDHRVTNHLSSGQFDDICPSANGATAAAISMASAAGVAVASAQSAVSKGGPSCGQLTPSAKVRSITVASDESKPPPIPIRTTSQMSKKHPHHRHQQQRQQQQEHETIEQVAHAMINCNPSLYHRQLQQMCQVSGHHLTTTSDQAKSSGSCSLLLMSPKPSVAMNQENQVLTTDHSTTKAQSAQSMTPTTPVTPITPIVPIAQDWVFLGRATLERSNHQTTQPRESTDRLVVPSPEEDPPICNIIATAPSNNSLRPSRQVLVPVAKLSSKVASTKDSSHLQVAASSSPVAASSQQQQQPTSLDDGDASCGHIEADELENLNKRRMSGSSYEEAVSLSNSPLSSLDNLSSLLLSSHSLASVMDDVTSSSSHEPSTQLSSESLHQIPSVNSEDESSKCSNVFCNEESSNITRTRKSSTSCSLYPSPSSEEGKKNDAESTSPNEGYKCKVTFDGSFCHPKGTFIDEDIEDTRGKIEETEAETRTRRKSKRTEAASSSSCLVNSTSSSSPPCATDGNDHPPPSPKVRSNGNVEHLDESYKCNPLKARQKTAFTGDERTNGTSSHYHTNNHHFTYSPMITSCATETCNGTCDGGSSFKATSTASLASLTTSPTSPSSASKGHRSSVQVTLYENKLSHLLNTHTENVQVEKEPI